MIVRVTEVDPICAMQACMDGYEVVSPYIDGVNKHSEESINKVLLEDTDLVVTSTGNYKVCDKHMLKALKKGAVVCNIGHFDTEIDTAFMRENYYWDEIKPQVHRIFRDTKAGDKPDLESGDYLILLSEGRLVNLGNATGHPLELWMALLQTKYWLKCIYTKRNLLISMTRKLRKNLSRLKFCLRN